MSSAYVSLPSLQPSLAEISRLGTHTEPAGIFLENCLPENLIPRPETSEQGSRWSPALSLSQIMFRMYCYDVAHHRAFLLSCFAPRYDLVFRRL